MTVTRLMPCTILVRLMQPQHRDRTGVEIIRLAASQLFAVLLSFRIARVEKSFPSDTPLMCGEGKRKKFVMGVKQQQQRVAVYGTSFVVFFLDCVAGQTHAERADVLVLPVLIGHLMPIRAEPGDVLDFGPTDASSLKELPPP
jgi:hypothetical protein